MRNLTLAERETVITFNESKEPAEIYTHNKRWQWRLEKLGIKPIRDNGYGGKTYQIEKSRIPLPRAKRVLTEAAKARLANQLRRIRNE